MQFEKKRSGAKTEIPTSSMPDIIFMLLLFFMVTTTLREVTVRVSFKLPEAEAVEKIENKRLVSYIYVGVGVHGPNTIQINDNIIAEKQKVYDVMSVKRAELPNVIVSLRVDKQSDMGEVLDIQQELRKAGCLRLSYSTMLKAPSQS